MLYRHVYLKHTSLTQENTCVELFGPQALSFKMLWFQLIIQHPNIQFKAYNLNTSAGQFQDSSKIMALPVTWRIMRACPNCQHEGSQLLLTHLLVYTGHQMYVSIAGCIHTCLQGRKRFYVPVPPPRKYAPNIMCDAKPAITCRKKTLLQTENRKLYYRQKRRHKTLLLQCRYSTNTNICFGGNYIRNLCPYIILINVLFN